MIIKLNKAEYLNGYKIKLTFQDHKTRTIDFRHFLENAQNPMTRKYLDINKFKEFSIEYGDLVWNDYELCFPIADLYQGVIIKEILSPV